jgi:hypothetical protein
MTTPEGLTKAEYQEIVSDAAASDAANRETLMGLSVSCINSGGCGG